MLGVHRLRGGVRRRWTRDSGRKRWAGAGRRNSNGAPREGARGHERPQGFPGGSQFCSVVRGGRWGRVRGCEGGEGRTLIRREIHGCAFRTLEDVWCKFLALKALQRHSYNAMNASPVITMLNWLFVPLSAPSQAWRLHVECLYLTKSSRQGCSSEPLDRQNRGGQHHGATWQVTRLNTLMAEYADNRTDTHC
jgi:hypothetical protein